MFKQKRKLIKNLNNIEEMAEKNYFKRNIIESFLEKFINYSNKYNLRNKKINKKIESIEQMLKEIPYSKRMIRIAGYSDK